MSTCTPRPAAISCVSSIGKPYVSWSVNASAPGSVFAAAPLQALEHVLLGDHEPLALARREREAHVEQHFLEHRPQRPDAGLALHRLVGEHAERLVGELELHAVHREHALELAHERVLRLGHHAQDLLA